LSRFASAPKKKLKKVAEPVDLDRIFSRGQDDRPLGPDEDFWLMSQSLAMSSRAFPEQ